MGNDQTVVESYETARGYGERTCPLAPQYNAIHRAVSKYVPVQQANRAPS